MKRAFWLLPVLTLSACVVPPIVTEFNGDSVTIQGADFTYDDSLKTLYKAEADRICGKIGKRAEYASSRAVPGYVMQHLYLCL